MVAEKYTRIVIIYNPHSTRYAETKANRLANRLKRRRVEHVDLHDTKYAGHAEELAYTAASVYEHPLIVSVSGDGGYNEVINGVLRAKDEGKAQRPVCTILPAGNANDHRRTTKKRPLTWAVLYSQPEPMSVLKLRTSGTGIDLVRYAHSYIGFGMTSLAAAEFNRERLTRWKELEIVYQAALNYEPFTIEQADRPAQKLNNLIFANIHQMSKIIRLGKRGPINSGLFRVIAMPHRSHLRFLLTLISIGLFGFRHPPQTGAYEFKLVETQLAHFDGEVTKIPGGSQIKIECMTAALLTIR